MRLNTQFPFEAKAPAPEALECRMATRADLLSAMASPPAEFMWMPGGVHQVSVSKAGKPLTLTIQVDRDTASRMQDVLEARCAAGKQKPWFDFDHDKNAASGWPTQFLWRDTPEPGVYVKVEWSRPGAEAISGKAYRSFSPTFYVDDEQANPAQVTGAPLNMGGLVNDPAFDKIQPLWAKRTSDPVMTPEELAALQAALKQLKDENAELKAKAASSETEAALTAKQTEIDNLNGKIVNLQAELTAKRKADAKAAVQAAVARGAIPPKDEALQAKWAGLIEANPDNGELLAKLPSTPIAKTVTKPEGPGAGADVQLTREDICNALKGYLEAKTPLDRGRIYRADINARLDKGEIIPFRNYETRLPLEGANTLGTLVGNIISQRTLALVVSKRPLLRAITTDLSDEGARLNQVVYVRTVGLPTVQDFPAGAAMERADTDYPLTLDQAKQVRYDITAAEYNATGRDLVREHSEAMAVALGNHMVDAAAALITDDFTEETVLAAASYDFSTLAAIAKAMNIKGVPDVSRKGWISAIVAEALKNDEVIMQNYDRESGSAYGHWRNIEGFEDIWEYPALPANAVNLIGFFSHPSAILLASRVLLNPQQIIGAGYPGRLQTVSDPVTGLSVISNQWVDQASLAVSDRLIVLFGVDKGNINCGHKAVSA